MALRAIGRETARDVVRIAYALIIILMAAVTIAGQNILVTGMAGVAANQVVRPAKLEA